MFLIQRKNNEKSPLRKDPKGGKKSRSLGLDALRGIAIIGMVFSGVFPHENPWPGYMFHAQVGPPEFLYTPEVPGITWVDLVFPFFLFTMGAAFPLALRRKVEQEGVLAVLPNILKRGALLLLFAVILRNLNWFDLQAEGWINQLTSLVTFGCFFLIFMRFKSAKKEWILKATGLGIMTAMLIYHDHFTEFSFNKNRNDTIIVVLANMAVFGSIIWLLTRNNVLLRMGIMAFFSAIWFTRDVEGSWTKNIWDFHPSLSWMYHFSYLKYLCIVLPGSVLGDLMLKFNRKSDEEAKRSSPKWLLVLISFSIIVANLYGLYMREILMNLFLTIGLLIGGKLVLHKFKGSYNPLYAHIFNWASFFVLLGLFMEPLDGGIKKDPSSFSFWFLTSGLAFLAFVICQINSDNYDKKMVWKSLIRSGQNPMVAYVVTAFFISTIFALTSVSSIFDYLHEKNIYLGLVKTFVITILVVALTSYTTKKRWLWKT